jgi:hypothetical protein
VPDTDDRQPAVYVALDEEGHDLPVIDITNPAFALETPEEVAELERRFADFRNRQQQMSPEAVAAAVEMMQGSRLGRSLMQAMGGYLSGMATYRLKLGPKHLEADATEMDRQIAGSLPAWGTRLRLHQVATLAADALAPRLARAPTRPLTLVDIAGGPASGALNTLLLRRATQPEALAGRPITIDVLDGDVEGPAFGARSLAALSVPGAPLHGLDIRLARFAYDWHDTGVLARHLDGLGGHVVAVSSEGGLFEYGSDAAIGANLATIRDHADAATTVVGSVTRGDGAVGDARGGNSVATIPRTLEEFRALAAGAGWVVDAVLEGPIGRQVRLTRAVTGASRASA